MKWIKAVWLPALAVFWAAAAFGAQKGPAETSAAPLVREYIEISGAGETLRSFSGQLDDMFERKRRVSQNREETDEIAKLFEGLFTQKKLTDEMSRHLLETVNQKDLEFFLKWLKGPLAQKALEGKRKALDKGALPPLSPGRLSLLKDLEKALGEVDFAVGAASEIFRGMMSAFNSGLPEKRRASRAEIDLRVENLRSMLRENMERGVMDEMARRLRNMTDQELLEYTVFYKSDIGKKETRARLGGISHVLKKGFADMEKRMVVYLNEPRSRERDGGQKKN
ncbi:exported hypothetical protein [Candidatus Desulfarcum epimagneticum]|uniref:DUF2059 domain-containing protein n=1 Tax=uncultured Desulfobacteraceae bacterium TaxID=218296 RepID=A0A484HCA6_9BACT|nr:exported hypothetical protein [uncultured Desulfobacteraceae bacterium]